MSQLSAQWQILRMFSYAVIDGNSFTQWWVPVGPLFPISNILYNRTHGRNIWVWVTKDDPPEGGGNHIHICYTSNVIFHDMAGAHAGHSRGKPHRHSANGYFWHFQTSCHPLKTTWQGGRLYRCHCFCGWRGFGQRRYFWEMDGRLHRFHLGIQGGIFLSVSKSGLAEGSPWQQPLARMGAAFDPIWWILWFFPWVVVPVQGVSLGHWWGKGLLNFFPHTSLGQLPPGKPPHRWRSDTTSPLLWAPIHLLLTNAGLTSSRQIILLHPVLESPGICHNFFPRDFSYVPTGKDWVRWQHKSLPMKAWQSRGSLKSGPFCI